MNCETVGMMQNNKTVRSCVFLLVLSVLLRRARDASDAMSDADANDVSVDKNLGVFSHLESGLFFFSLFFFHFFRVGTL